MGRKLRLHCGQVFRESQSFVAMIVDSHRRFFKHAPKLQEKLWVATEQPSNTGSHQTVTAGSWLDILKRQTDGSWRIARSARSTHKTEKEE